MIKLVTPLIIAAPIFITAQETKKQIVDSVSLQKEIEMVTLSGKKKLIERKVDRLVFNVENSVAVQGGDAMDALKVTPGIRISGDDIKITGKSSVKVMMNDKIVQLGGEELQNYLKSIPAESITKIEVITNPPAKYDAEGNSGLINIQLKEAKQNNWNATLRSNYQQGFYAQFTEGAAFSYRKDKLSLLTDINYRFGKYLYTNEINYYYPQEHWNNHIFNRSNRKSLGTLFNISYDITDKTTLGAQFMGSFTERETDEFNDNYSNSYTDEKLLKYYKTRGYNSGKPNSYSVNFNINHKIDDKGKKYSIDADFFENNTPKNGQFNSDMNNYANTSLDQQFATNNSSQNIQNYSVKTDFELPYNWANISFGAKASNTKTKNLVDSHFFQLPSQDLLSEQSNHFEYTENNQAIYISAQKALGKKWEAKTGLRGEFTQTNSNSITLNQQTKRDYFKLFPTAYLSYKPSDNHTVSLNYGKRIGRPAYFQMDPAKWYTSATSYVTGNPFIQPTFTDMLELNYSYKSLLTVNLYGFQSKDDISQMIYHDPSKETVVMRHENYAKSKGSGGTLTVNYSPFKWWQSSTDVSAYYNETNPYLSIYEKRRYTGWGGGSSTNNTFVLNKKKTFLASLNYWYSFPSLSWGLSEESSSLDIGVRYMSENKKLSVGLNFDDIFKNSQTKFSNFMQGIKQSFNQYYDSQRIRLSLSYKFGNNKISVNQREGGNKEEKNRAN
ncbi:TonB-dependent receptor [Chryseobacterium sp. NEB161]|nr:TonB-dependent receptor [Chryseobacterium sp. NEB161]